MAVKEVLLLGNPKLYESSREVERNEIPGLMSVIADLHDTLMDFRRKHGAGRAIAAPQIGVMKRLVYIHIDEPLVIIDPIVDRRSEALMEVWDDCMCFPDILVRVFRHRRCRLLYRDLEWRENSVNLEDDWAELVQHECDHLDGILAVSRAIDGRAFALRSQRRFLSQDR